ncbi:MAG TPA: hypothetical protein DCZ12_12115 [Gammaproteobacteria bacterium]|nr:hypothetical protein [Gammaproteobacteria bacterium]
MTTQWTVQQGTLPHRQAQVLSGLANGLTNKEIAEEAGIKPTVVSGTINTLFCKFHLSRGRRASLVAEAINSGVLSVMSNSLLVLLAVVQLLVVPAHQPTRAPNPIRTRPPAVRLSARPARSNRRD